MTAIMVWGLVGFTLVMLIGVLTLILMLKTKEPSEFLRDHNGAVYRREWDGYYTIWWDRCCHIPGRWSPNLGTYAEAELSDAMPCEDPAITEAREQVQAA